MFNSGVSSGTAVAVHPEAAPFVHAARPLAEARSSCRARDVRLGYYRGPFRYPRAAQLAAILRSPEVAELVNAAAPKEAAQHLDQASRFAARMLPRLDPLVYNLMGLLLRGAIAALYDGIRVEGTDRVRALDERVTRIYVASHSGGHADYLFQIYGMAQVGFRAPLTVASEHLDMAGIGPLLRRCGALYVRRGGGPPIYRAVFGAALGALLRGGWDLLVFPEGGPSVDGRPRRIRTGFLRELVRQARRGLGRPVALVPVNLRHDRHFEEEVFLRVAARGSWCGEGGDDWRGLLRSLSRLRKRFGTLHMQFGRPRLLDELLAAAAEPDAAAARGLAGWVGESIQAAAPLTAASLAAVSLLPAAEPLDFEEVVDDAERVAAVLSAIAPEMSPPDAAVPLAEQLRTLRHIELVDDERGRLKADGHQRARLALHRNLALSRLVVPAMVSRSLLAGIDRPAAIAAAWQHAFSRVRDKLYLAVPPAGLQAAVERCLRALVAQDVALVVGPGEQVALREWGRALAMRLADAFDLERDVDAHVEVP
jgi:glycerol-3-phosphate O-acyltransferase